MPSSPAPTKPLRVAIVSFGFEEYCLSLVNALSRLASVALVMPEASREIIDSRIAADVQIVSVDMPRLRQPVRQLQKCTELVRQLRALSPDVIHLQQGHLWFNFALPFLESSLVVTIHDHTCHPGDRLSAKTPQWAHNLGFRRADHVIVLAESLKREVRELGRVAPDIPVHVVPLQALVEPPSMQPAPTEPNTVLFFGRLWPYKGLEYLIRAEPLVSEAVPDVRIVIAGQGEDFERYRAMMRNAERFEVYNEFIEDDLRDQLFARAGIVVLPYIEASQSGVVPVAYAFAKPVVATTVGGLPEMVDHNRTGLLVPPRDEDALAGAIVELLSDEERRTRLGEAGLRKLNTELSPDVVARKTLDVYLEATEKREARAA